MNNKIEVRNARGTLAAYKIGNDLPEGLCAYSKDEDFVQVLSWNYTRGKKLQPHSHKIVPRVSDLTQEAVVVLQGSMRVDVYDTDRRIYHQTVLKVGECMVFLADGHGYEILEDGTRILEIKNGPFPGVEADKEKFQP